MLKFRIADITDTGATGARVALSWRAVRSWFTRHIQHRPFPSKMARHSEKQQTSRGRRRRLRKDCAFRRGTGWLKFKIADTIYAGATAARAAFFQCAVRDSYIRHVRSSPSKVARQSGTAAHIASPSVRIVDG